MAKKNSSTAQPKWTTDQIKLRAHASACALDAFGQQLEAVDARLQAVEKERLTKATQTYRSIMREDYANPPSPDIKVIHYDTACEGLATHDAVLEANSLARKARKAERDRVGKALREFLTTRPTTADNQLQLLPPASDASGLGLYTDEARLVAYTALVELDKTGGLDDDQRALMVDLAGAGIEPIAFVLDAGEAVEESDDEPSEDDEQVLHEIDELGSRVLQPAANDLVL